jgi:hypothetical protein
MDADHVDRLQRSLLIHLLNHRGQQVRFEADQWTTEFGILRKFGGEDQLAVRQALRALEIARCVYRRVQYVIGYTEPKLVYSLTPNGHRKALELRREDDPSGDLGTDPSRPYGSPDNGGMFSTTSPPPEP